MAKSKYAAGFQMAKVFANSVYFSSAKMSNFDSKVSGSGPYCFSKALSLPQTLRMASHDKYRSKLIAAYHSFFTEFAT